MNRGWVHLALLFAIGLGLGGAYFGGLWMTLRRCSQWRRPFLGMGLSLLGRLALLLGGGAWVLHLAMAPRLAAILAISCGFWLSRLAWAIYLLEMAAIPTTEAT